MAPCGGDTFTAKLFPLGGFVDGGGDGSGGGGGKGVGCCCRTLEMTVSPFKTSGRPTASATVDSDLSRRRLAASPLSPALSLSRLFKVRLNHFKDQFSIRFCEQICRRPSDLRSKVSESDGSFSIFDLGSDLPVEGPLPL